MTETKGHYSARRVDANQAEIVEALRKAGATVQILSGVGHGCPDLLIGYHGRNILIEVKTATGKITDDELAWITGWKGRAYVARSVEQVLEILNQIVQEVDE